MSEPGSIQKKQAASREKVTDAAANPVEKAGRREATSEDSSSGAEIPARPRELGGPAGPEPTRYGDWERKGRCIDF